MAENFERYESRSPWVGSIGAIVSSLVVTGLVAHSRTAVLLAGTGVVSLGAGLWLTDGRFVTAAVVALLGAVIYTGIDRPPAWLLVAAVPVVLAWGMANVAVRLGQQVGRSGETLRVELVHSIGTLTVLTFAGGYGYVTFQSVTGTQSPLVVALLLGSTVVTVLVLR